MKTVTFEDVIDFCPKSKRKASEGMSSGKYPFYRSSQLVNTYCEYADYDGCKLIFGTGGSASVHYADIPFSTSADCIVAKAKDDSEVYLPYIFYYFRGNIHVLEEGFRGAGLKHISKEYIRRIKIPLPTFEKQRRIAAILDKADAVCRKRQEAIRLTEELLRSAFLDMFGDPVTNPKGWPTKQIGEICTVTTGNTPSRSNPDYYGDYIEWIKSDNVNTPDHILTTAEEYLSKAGMAVGRTVEAGSILVTCIAGSRSSIGKVAIADRKVAFNQQINALTPHPGIEYRFLYTTMLLAKKLVQAVSTDSMKGLVSKGRLQKVRLPIPPTPKQQAFSRVFEQILELQRRNDQGSSDSSMLFNSLVQRTFKGEL